MKFKIFLLLVLLFTSQSLSAQETTFEDGIRKNLQQHITILASDQMMGREAGGAGEVPASRYVAAIFKSVGLKSAFEDGYYQNFAFSDGAELGYYNYLNVGGSKFKLHQDYYPLAYSAAVLAKAQIINVGFGISAPENNYDDYKEFNSDDLDQKLFVIELSSPDGVHPHSKYTEHSGIRKKIELAIRKGARGIIFINSDETLEDPKQKLGRDIVPYDIPIIFGMDSLRMFINSYSGSDVFDLRVDINRKEKTGNNVIGLIDNKAKNYVVIGAHYDHLGLGIEGSLYRDEKKQVHNGADDNASGVALLTELGRHLLNYGPKKYNYVLIAFTGEEKGLLGSNYYVKNPVVAHEKVSFMLNFDMVGRLTQEDPVLIVNGVGTAKEWETLMNAVDHDNFEITTTESGIGPSDHTSFYLENIPVLHFFSGTHKDYHKPSDDVDKINFNGIVDIGHYVLELIMRSDAANKFEFVKTKDENIFKAPKFTVTLGVVPDYAYSEEGMRIDGVTDGKPASGAGLIKGDVVIQLGSYSVRDMSSYMEALSKFKKGDKTTVTYKRGEDSKTTDIQF